ncbi:MAG: GTPase Era, partial [Bacteroidaceae bacterium]|nr:GTPase Era [Bacteroidaceae bacterium]
SMRAFSDSALSDVDVLLYVTDTVESEEKNADFIEAVNKLNVPKLVLINKIDLIDEKTLIQLVERWEKLIPGSEIYPVSAKARFNVDNVMRRIKELLPDSPPYFDKDQLTDKPMRFFVSEIVREKILLYYDKEIPYCVEVTVDEYKESDNLVSIQATINVEHESQKGIIIGRGGFALKKVSTEARKSLEKFLQKKVFIRIFVSVDKGWRNSNRELAHFGYRN